MPWNPLPPLQFACNTKRQKIIIYLSFPFLPFTLPRTTSEMRQGSSCEMRIWQGLHFFLNFHFKGLVGDIIERTLYLIIV